MSWANALPAGACGTPVHIGVPPALLCRPAFIRATVDWAHLVVLDFETYWDADYTLSKLSTSEYIRDERFHAHLVGVKVGRKRSVVVPASKLKAFLQGIDWDAHDLLCHNTAFDGFILSHHFGVVPRRYYDTLSMARGLHSNDIGAALDEVARYYGVGNKVPNVLERTKGVRTLDKALYRDVAAYCVQDVELTLAIFRLMHAEYPAVEIELIDVTIRMFCDPVLLVDIPRVEAELARELAERETLLLSIDTAGFDHKKLTKTERELPPHEKRLLIARKIVGSNDAFADLLRACGVTPPLKISPAWLKASKADRLESKKWAYAFAKDDTEFTELPTRPDEWSADLDLGRTEHVKQLAIRQARIEQLVEVRLAVKSTTNITRAERFLTAGANGMALPAGYAYYRAHTGRWGGNNKMNMQNLTRGGALRLSILAPPGYVLVVGDSGQIECRVNGWLWGQEDLLNDLRESDAGRGRDAYCTFGDLIYKREITKLDKVERFVSKVAVLGLGFGMAATKFQITLAKGALGGPPVYFDLEQCKGIVNTYRRKNYRIINGWAICNRIIEDMAAGRTGTHGPISWKKNKIWLPNGMALHYPDLQQAVNPDTGWPDWTYAGRNGSRKKIYGGLLCENIVQALARIIVAEQLLNIVKHKQRRLVMITHDEGVLCVLKRSGPQALKELMAAMKTPLSWCPDLPLNSEGGFAANYSK
jgi:DNA polymerase III epsilon subunit-like protein